MIYLNYWTPKGHCKRKKFKTVEEARKFGVKLRKKGGNCDKCRRKAYCTKTCTAKKRKAKAIERAVGEVFARSSRIKQINLDINGGLNVKQRTVGFDYGNSQ